MSFYIKPADWKRWTKRAENMANELIGLSKGIDPQDISHSRDIAELAHLGGAIKHLYSLVRECRSGLQSAERGEVFNDISNSY